MALWRLYVDSNSGIDVDPEYDLRLDHRKIESVHRVRSGEQYRYKWGQYLRWRLSLTWVNTTDFGLVNSWWFVNQKLLFQYVPTGNISSVMIVNPKSPMTKFQAPYIEFMEGTIELETY